MGKRGRTEESEDIRAEFINDLKEYCKNNGYEFIGRLPKREEYSISKDKTFHVLSIKVSTSESGFWGENEKRFKELDEVIKNNNKTNKSAIIEMAIILLKTSKRGYLLKRSEFNDLKKSPSRGEFKINENNSFSKYEFDGLNNIFSRLEVK